MPADSATIGLTDKILTRIQTRESVSKISSAFMIDLQQMTIALRLATRRSLLIIDEFGKGTESIGGIDCLSIGSTSLTQTVDGAGLACAIFEHLLKLEDQAPKAIGATHYHGSYTF